MVLLNGHDLAGKYTKAYPNEFSLHLFSMSVVKKVRRCSDSTGAVGKRRL